MPPVKNLSFMTSYGGIIRIRCRNCPKTISKGRSSRTPSQPASTSSPVFVCREYFTPIGDKMQGFSFFAARFVVY